MFSRYGLVGHPLGHSFSKKFHNERFAAMGIEAEYVNFDLDDIASLPEVIAADDALCGLNVTIPYKRAVLPFLDALDATAARIGAVNTICIDRTRTDGQRPGYYLTGYNTDLIGFRDSIRPLLDTATPRPTHALILGTGGASAAVRVALEDLGLKVCFVSRTAAEGRLTYGALTEAVMQQYTVVVNASPVGTFPNVDECPQIPYQWLSPAHICYDLVYNPSPTLFLRKAAAQGARTMGGTAMLKGQAIAAYQFWTQA